MAKAEIHQTSGLRGDRWAWCILLEDHHPYAISKDSFPTLDEAIEDLKVNGIEKLIKAAALERNSSVVIHSIERTGEDTITVLRSETMPTC